MRKKFIFPEGATPLNDFSGLIPEWVHHLGDLNRVEAENIMKAQRKHLQGPARDPRSWFQLAKLRAMHQDMFGDVWSWAGSYRKSGTSIGVASYMISSQLAEFCYEVTSWLQYPVELTFMEMAARIHHRLVFIHPFENGNGRFSRLVSDKFLYAFRCSYPMWPSYLNREGIVREDYIKALKSADRGDYTLLISFMRDQGASDPKLSELVMNSFYREYVTGEKGVAMIRALLRNGSNPNEQTMDGSRVLHLAVKANLEEVVRVLLDFGVETSSKDQNGLTAFQVASRQGNKALMNLLSEAFVST